MTHTLVSAIIDTNILVSAMLSPRGNEALIILAIKQGSVKPYFSLEILDEYASVLSRAKSGFDRDEIVALSQMLRSFGSLAHPTPL